MDDKDTEGTVLSHMKPVVTMLTDTLEKNFVPNYERMEHFPAGSDERLWMRTNQDGSKDVITSDELYQDVEAWLLSLEQRMETDSDRAYAQIIATMIHKNKGWVTLLTNRVKKKLA